MKAKKKKKPGPKPGARPRRRIKPPVHPHGEALLGHAKLIANLEQLIASAHRRLTQLQMNEVETLERIRESLQATLNMHQLSIQGLRDVVAARETSKEK